MADVDNVSHLSNICLHIFYNFNWITHILAKSIKWFVTASSDTLEYSKLVQHIFVWHVEIYIHVQYSRLVYEINRYQVCIMLAMHMFQGVTSYTNVSSIRSGYNQLDDW